LLGANIGAVHVGNRIWVPQTMAMTNNADDVVAARAGRNSPQHTAAIPARRAPTLP